MKLTLSSLPKCWILDIDGTIVKHNGHIRGHEELLAGVKACFDKIQSDDKVILLTSREETYRQQTEKILSEFGIRYDYILFNMPHGERILVNDRKVSGLRTAYAINVDRDKGFSFDVCVDERL